MAVQVASLLLLILAVYLGAGLVFALAFVTRGISIVDHAARGAPWSFRLLILPGAAALWPLLLRKWRRAARGAAP